MALKIFEKFSPRANPADADYPYGSIKNESVPGAEDGTPLDASWGNDMLGFTDALLDEAGITPNGLPDTVQSSQRLDALKTVVREPLELKIFQSPTDNLTKVSTFAGGVGVVYEVRKTSDNLLATIYNDKDGVTSIPQNGTANVSNGDAEAVFYIADGSYSITINSLSSGFDVGHNGLRNRNNANAHTASAITTNSGTDLESFVKDSYVKNGSYKNLLDGVSEVSGLPCVFRKVDATRFEIFTPFVQSGRFLRWRFDNDDGQFNGVPDDTAQAYTRPFLQTTVTDVYLENAEEVSIDTATASSVVTDIGSYKYIEGVGESFEFTGIRASRLRCTIYKASNAGIIKVTINGSSQLVNLIDKDGSGDALIDTYAATAGGASILLAENLPDIDLTVKFEIVGQNPSSSGNRMYFSDLANPQALRLYTAYDGVGTPTEESIETLKLGGSAVDYAISFRPDSQPLADTPFIGSVHGYENRESLKLYIDNTLTDLSLIADGALITAKNSVTLIQDTKLFHPDELVSAAAEISLSWVFNSAGAKQGYTGKWLYSPFITNGYTNMWTVYGANSGGAGGVQAGWADRVILSGYGSYTLEEGDSTEKGNKLTNEVLFYGTPTSENRNEFSGDTACLVSLTDLNKSFSGFKNEQSIIDGVWVQDRSTFRKMYLQSLRAAGTYEVNETFGGSMSVSFYKSPLVYNLVNQL